MIKIRSKETFYLFCILIIGLGLRLWGLSWGLPHEYQTEEYKVIKYALKMGGGDLNPHFFEYPSLYLYFMLFIFGCYFIIGKTVGFFHSTHEFASLFIKDPTSFYLLGRLFETFFSLGVIFFTYKIGKKIFSEKIGLIAAFLASILPEFVYKSHIAKGDMAAVFLGLLFWIFLYKIYETGEKKYYFFSSMALGFAISTKYYMAIMTPMFIIAYFLSPKRNSYISLIGWLMCVPLFFVLGTPYSIIARKEFFQFLGDQSSLYSTFTGTHATYFQRFLDCTGRLLRLTDFPQSYIFGTYIMGILAFFGLTLLIKNFKKEYFFCISPLFLYWAVVSGYHNPAAGYLTPIFPFFLIMVSSIFYFFPDYKFLNKAQLEKGTHFFPKIFVLFFFLIAVVFTVKESVKISYAYSLMDTRTIAKEWIENNIPKNKKILLDILAHSPPLEMNKEQLGRFYQIALLSNHYKKEYFKLKLEIIGEDKIAYHLFMVRREPREIGSLPHQVEEVQKVQDLVTIQGNEADFEKLRELDINYVVTNSWAINNANRESPKLAAFYGELPKKLELLYTETPKSKIHPGPEICVYKINY